MHIPIFVAIIIALVMVIVLIIFTRKRVALRRARLEHDNENKQLQQPQEKEAKRAEKRLSAVAAKVPHEVKTEPHAEGERPFQVPEDSTLRRHFLTQLRVDVEAELPPRPTDPTLRRHYDHMVVAEMEERVGEPLPEAPVAESVPIVPAVPLHVVESPVRQEVKAREAVKAKPAAAGPL